MAEGQSIDCVGVVGMGFMGSGIAESCARAEIEVIGFEPEQDRLDRAQETIRGSVERAAKRGNLDTDAVEPALERISFVTELDAMADCQVVIEAATEDVEVKREIFSSLDGLLGEEALLASNTSSIPIAQLAAATERSERVCGLHFFSPVPVMALVEVVRALDTSEETIATAETFCSDLGKKPIHTKDRSGFVVNMLLVPYLMAAVRMYEDGFATRESIDEGMKLGCGHPMGPLALCDFIGLDVLYSVCNSLYEEFKRAEYAPPPLIKRMVAADRLGRKTGIGFYEYD